MSSKLWPKGLLYSTCYNVASTLQVQNNIRRDYTNLGPPTQQNPEVAPAVPIIDISKQYIQQASSNLTHQAHCGDIDPNGQAPCQKGYGLCEIIPPPSCVQGSGSTNGRSIGYYQASNTRDRLCNRISPSQINLDGLTHLYFAFAKFDATSYQMVPGDSGDIELYTQFTALQSKGVKTWIAVGGFDFSDPGTTRTAWSNMTASSAGRSAFITSLKSFMQKYKFQGVDLDWEYPGTPERGGQRADTQNFLALVKEMRASFGSQYGISLTLAPDYWYLRGFAAKEMEPYVDFFGFMAYDLHGSWDTDVKTLGSIVRGQADIRDISNDTLPLWFDKLNPTKLNFGLAYYGRGYTLANPSCNTLGCPFSGPSKPGICTNYGGVMSLLEIQNLIKQKGLTPKLLPDSMMKQITWDNQWIGYDDADTIKLKKAWADGQCFGGTMIWSVDFNSGSGSGDVPSNTTDGSCGPAHGGTVRAAAPAGTAGATLHTAAMAAKVEIVRSEGRPPMEPVVSTGRIPSAVHLQAAAAARARATVGATMPIAVLAVNQAALRQMGPAGSLRNTIPAKALCTGTAALRMGIVEAMLRTVEPAAKTVTVSQELQTSLPTAHVARPLARSVAIGQMAAAVLRPHIVVMTMHTAVLAVNQALVYGPARMTVSVKAQIVTTDNVQGRCAWLSAASARVAPKANAHFPPYVYRKGVSALTASMASVLATVAPRVAAKENNALRPQGTARAMTALALDVTDRTVILIPVAVSICRDH
ncbi:hypothetical protein B0A48_13489 [Cryoendolithus antarcticus]|uniref:chitinase n=1 Tax=Cryoendolithus antarcticus TaxID=1507870 RepID=A0A1V8SPH5_9PEZI|nr:hypothetical protein B0A48_13489 [Cryoendolithus antarcticus]